MYVGELAKPELEPSQSTSQQQFELVAYHDDDDMLDLAWMYMVCQRMSGRKTAIQVVPFSEVDKSWYNLHFAVLKIGPYFRPVSFTKIQIPQPTVSLSP